MGLFALFSVMTVARDNMLCAVQSTKYKLARFGVLGYKRAEFFPDMFLEQRTDYAIQQNANTDG